LYADDGGDSCYAPDAGRAIALLVTADHLSHTTYNVSSGRPLRNHELAAALQVQTKPGGRPNPHLDITRLIADTGFAPQYDTAEAVAHYIAWRSDNPR
jgi:nucleoside-diphosphate-sugar epimerase